MKQKTVLYCVLNWGIGHATRSTVVIHKLLQVGFDVHIASDGTALKVLKRNFSKLKFIELPGYGIKYPKHGSMVFSLIMQLPKLFTAIKNERKCIEAECSQVKYNYILSDHRYGCYHKNMPSIFLAHQLQPLMPKGMGFLQGFFNSIHKRMLRHFDDYWIPDIKVDNNLSGLLSKSTLHSQKYIGLLSALPDALNPVKRFAYIALLSGPEPQRTELYKILADQMKQSGKACLLIRGIPGEDIEIETNGNFSEVGFLSGATLSRLLLGADLIFARSGYSTIMDLAKLKRRAVFIPTPGQTEQLYLAESLANRSIAFYMEQASFDLTIAAEQSKNYSGFEKYFFEDSLLDQQINSL